MFDGFIYNSLCLKFVVDIKKMIKKISSFWAWCSDAFHRLMPFSISFWIFRAWGFVSSKWVFEVYLTNIQLWGGIYQKNQMNSQFKKLISNTQQIFNHTFEHVFLTQEHFQSVYIVYNKQLSLSEFVLSLVPVPVPRIVISSTIDFFIDCHYVFISFSSSFSHKG